MIRTFLTVFRHAALVSIWGLHLVACSTEPSESGTQGLIGFRPINIAGYQLKDTEQGRVLHVAGASCETYKLMPVGGGTVKRAELLGSNCTDTESDSVEMWALSDLTADPLATFVLVNPLKI